MKSLKPFPDMIHADVPAAGGRGTGRAHGRADATAAHPIHADPAERRLSAYHEAGHAAMLWLLGRSAERVAPWGIDGTSVAHVRSDELPAPPLLIASNRRFDRRVGTVPGSFSAMIHLAGTSAENRVGGNHPDWCRRLLDDLDSQPATSDTARALDAAVAATGADHSNECKVWAFLRQRGRWTDECLGEPRTWAVVEALAGRLVEVDAIYEEEVRALSAAACGGPPPGLGHLWEPWRDSPKWRRRFATPGRLVMGWD